MTDHSKTKPILRVLAGEPLSRRPIWFMRQAGRYLPEYRQLRANAGDFMTLCFTPKLASEITLQPIRRFGFDGAILFSDILVIPHALGQKLWFAEGEGPKLEKLAAADFAKLKTSNLLARLAPIFETVVSVRAALPSSVTLLGFAGAPWTVANYMIAGGSSDESEHLRRFMYQHPEGLEGLMDLLVEATSAYLIEQVRAGAEALQVFESWGAAIPANRLDQLSITPIQRIISEVRRHCPDIPFIVFPRGTGARYGDYARLTGTNGLSVDYQTSLAGLKSLVGGKIALQGNLDPMLLATGGSALARAVSEILAATNGSPHIFNLGHGIRQETPLENVQKVIDQIRNVS